MKIALDFDGTCVIHKYPEIGDEVPFCVMVLKRLLDKKHRFILNTMRSGETLEEALKWFLERNILLYGIQVDPDQLSWTKSPKCFADIYVDDRSIGCPLIRENKRKYVDWLTVEMIIDNRENV